MGNKDILLIVFVILIGVFAVLYVQSQDEPQLDEQIENSVENIYAEIAR